MNVYLNDKINVYIDVNLKSSTKCSYEQLYLFHIKGLVFEYFIYIFRIYIKKIHMNIHPNVHLNIHKRDHLNVIQIVT